MNLTVEQQRAIHGGQAVPISVSGAECVVVRKDICDRASEPDYAPWSSEEIDLLAAEAVAIVAQVSTNMDEQGDPAYLFIAAA